MSRLTKYGDYHHQATLLAEAMIKLGNEKYLAISPIRPTTVTISSVATSDANWTELASGLSNVLMWRASELNMNDFHYAFTAAPGDNFSVATGWVSQQTAPTAIYIKRTAGDDITVKLEYWTA